MKCKKCKNEIPDGSNFCNICGAKQVRDDEIPVPEPRRRKDGTYAAQLYRHGVRATITGKTKAEYKARARAFKLDEYIPEGIDDELKNHPLIFGDLLDKYIASKEGKLSPATIRNLESIRRSRFMTAMEFDIRIIDFQRLIDYEATLVSPNTVITTWNSIKPMFTYFGLEVPAIALPKAAQKDEEFLDSTQIPILLAGIKGNEYEPAVLLALHSLRLSELCAIKAEDIYDGFIHVNKRVIPDKANKRISLDGNKTDKSTRNIPVMIDRLYDVVPTSGLIVKQDRGVISDNIKRICKRLGLPPCSCHDLRRSFCSLCYEKGVREEYLMAYGGWSNYATVHKYYIKLSEKSKIENAEVLRHYFKITSMSGNI